MEKVNGRAPEYCHETEQMDTSFSLPSCCTSPLVLICTSQHWKNTRRAVVIKFLQMPVLANERSYLWQHCACGLKLKVTAKRRWRWGGRRLSTSFEVRGFRKLRRRSSCVVAPRCWQRRKFLHSAAVCSMDAHSKQRLLRYTAFSSCFL